MSANSNVLEDDSLLSKLDRVLFKVESFMALAGGLAVFSLMILAVVSVSGRNLANSPLPGYVDWIEQAMPLIAFIGVSYTQRLGGHCGRAFAWTCTMDGRACLDVHNAGGDAAACLGNMVALPAGFRFQRPELEPRFQP